MKDIFLLDMDETLLDFTRAERENFFATLARFCVPADEPLLARFHEINDGLWKMLERGEIAREKLVVERFRLLFEERGICCDAAAVAAYYYENFAEICFPFEGAAAFAETLARRGRVFIVTNGGAAIQRRHIADGGFAGALSGVFISEEMGCAKPSREYADFVKAHIPNFSDARAVWVGDSLTSDMACARVAGVDFILFSPRGAPKSYRGICCKTYAEILKTVQTL